MSVPAVAGGLDPDRDEARRLLSEELAHPDYHRPASLVERAVTWVVDLLGDLLGALGLAGGPGRLAAVLLGVVLLAAALTAWLAVRGRLRSRALARTPRGGVLEDPALTAADYRARAREAADRGDWDGVLLDSYRATAADADERALLPPSPGLTAHEVAALLAGSFPDHAAALRRAGDRFDAVRYGGQRAGRDAAEEVRALQAELAGQRPAAATRGVAR